jgi:hypothetical protein
MVFSVSAYGGNPPSATAVPKATAKEAIEKALSLMGAGMSEVIITDASDGRTYTSDDFDKLLKKYISSNNL